MGSVIHSPEHNAKPGPLIRCQVCGSSELHLIIDLGHQPPCDSLLDAAELQAPEVAYPLALYQCAECTLAQLSYVVPAEKVYPRSYPYRAGISWPVVAAHKAMAEDIVARFGAGHCIDIGSNDGTLLAQLKSLGCTVLGFEPTNIAGIANAAGVPTIQTFFNHASAKLVPSAHIVTLTNVFAHMADLGDVMRGICSILDPGGVLVIENHYLLDILELCQFDSIYHEHVRTYTLRSLVCLFEQYGLEVFASERVPRYGGNIRVFVGWKGAHLMQGSVGEMLALEDAFDYRVAAARFRAKVYRARNEFNEFSLRHALVGCSAPGRASTLLNFYGVSRFEMPWTGEIAGSLKIGKYLPGCHIAVESNERIVKEQPTHLVLLAWHYADEIAARLRREGVRSTLIAPLPYFRALP